MEGWFKNMGRGNECCDDCESVCCSRCPDCDTVHVAMSEIGFGEWANGDFTLEKVSDDEDYPFRFYSYKVSDQTEYEGEKTIGVYIQCVPSSSSLYFIGVNAIEQFYTVEGGEFVVDPETGERYREWEQVPFYGDGMFDGEIGNGQVWGGIATVTCLPPGEE